MAIGSRAVTAPPTRAQSAPARRLPAGSQAAALGLLALALLAIPLWWRGSQRRAEIPQAITRESPDTISFPARVESGKFHRRLLGMPGYHFLVHGGGSAAPAALLVTEVTDVQVLEALTALGGVPGDDLEMDTWEARRDPASPAPDRVIAGPSVEVLVRVPGRATPLPLDQVLEDPAGRGFDMRFGGHRANIPHWHSGCVICLYSCPGSKIGNARYTVRDYTAGTTEFRARAGVLPADGESVEVVLRLLPARP